MNNLFDIVKVWFIGLCIFNVLLAGMAYITEYDIYYPYRLGISAIFGVIMCIIILFIEGKINFLSINNRNEK
jgi:hypothetical protein